jgi:diguanylate cyclase (GGDEF)-like protein
MVLPAGAERFIDRSIPGSDPQSTFGHSPLVEDSEGRVLAPATDGIARWEKTAWRLIGPANGLLRISRISGMKFDAAGDLWLSGTGSGIHHWIGYRDWEGWTDTQGLPSAMIWNIAPLPNGQVMVGTETGPARIAPHSGSVENLTSNHPWAFGQLDAMGVDPNGSLWAGTFSGATLRIDPKTGHTVQTARLPGGIQGAFTDARGQVFFATEQGVYSRDAGSPNAAPRRVAAADALLGDSPAVQAGCASRDGSVWFVAENRLLHFQGGQWSVPRIDGMHKLNGLLLTAFCTPDGAVWVTGEQAGVWRIAASNWRFQADRLELPSELQPLAFVAMLVDRRGWVWLGSDSGLAAWNGNNWRHLTQESGLIWNDIDQGVMRESADGSLWIGTSGGVAHLLHPEHTFDPVPIDVSVTGIRRGSELFSGMQQIKLPWSDLPLQFQISSTSTRNRSELIFEYRMEGLQPDWIQSQDGMAIFSGLPPGEYTFIAMAGNPGLLAYSDIVKVQVAILPPWWRSKWFFALCILAILLLVVAADRFRAQRVHARSRQLARMVRERTLELEERKRDLEERTHELEVSREQLRIQAIQDGLTGLLNHVAVLRAFAAEMERARRESRTLVLAMVDLDHFKAVNDAHGHLAGDEALRLFAAAVSAAIRTYDHAGRYGGEEFLLVLSDIPREEVHRRLEKLHVSISNLRVTVGESMFTLNCSIGAALYEPSQGLKSSEFLLTMADQALYLAKQSGRNHVVFRDAHSQEAGLEKPPEQLPQPL